MLTFDAYRVYETDAMHSCRAVFLPGVFPVDPEGCHAYSSPVRRICIIGERF